MSSLRPLISIIIPVYNTEQYLSVCIESIISQDYPHFEIILVDDGSTDRSGQLCDDWAARDARIVVLHRDNAGAAAARNTGIDAAQGNYLLFLDSDDYWLNDQVLSAIDQRISRTSPDVLIYNLQKDYGNRLDAPYFSETIYISESDSTKKTIQQITENHLWSACLWNKAVRATLFQDGQLRLREGITAEDIEWSGRLVLHAGSFDFLNTNVVGYRQRESSVTGTMTTKKFRCLLENVQMCAEMSSRTEGHRKQLLETYTAFQFGTLIYGYSTLPKTDEHKAFLPKIQKLEYLLKLSNHPNVKLIRYVRSLFGLHPTLTLLRTRALITAHRKKRSD